MTGAYLLMPEIVVTVLAMLMLVLDAALRERQKPALTWLALIGFLVAGVLNLYQWGDKGSAYGGMVGLDNFTVFLETIFLFTAI
ncbi:MAG: hypothetical protein KGJ86_17330, partial [Chloroflexota bacterium]|nr:hypothetical protein [Chloroflexota bacterium]